MTMIPLLWLFSSRNSWKNLPIGHLAVSKLIWKEFVAIGDTVIDATCGNGHDSLQLARLSLSDEVGALHCLDIQEDAILSSKERLQRELTPSQFSKVQFHHQSHERFPSSIPLETVSLICYNLGYLPGIERSLEKGGPIITRKESTLASLSHASKLLREGGLLSVTAYPGHEGGDEETESVREYLGKLDSDRWRVHEYRPLNRPKSPHLLLAMKLFSRPS